MNSPVIVTGASRGIGRAIAVELAGQGFPLLLAAREREALETAAGECRALGASVDALAIDLLASDAAERIAQEAGQPYALVNNAGMAESAPLALTDDALIQRHLELNFLAPMRLMRALAPAMAANGGGRVVNVLSTAALAGYPYVSAYAASKHALLGATRSLAREFAGKGVTFNAVCPGYVRTEMFAQTVANIAAKTGSDLKKAEERLMRLSPQNRIFEPAEVAHAVAFLLSDAAAGINGQALSIDGGEIEH